MTSNDANDVTAGTAGTRLKGTEGGWLDDGTKWHRKTYTYTRHANTATRHHRTVERRRLLDCVAARSHARLVEPAKSLPANRSSWLATRRARGQGRKLNGANKQTLFYNKEQARTRAGLP